MSTLNYLISFQQYIFNLNKNNISKKTIKTLKNKKIINNKTTHTIIYKNSKKTTTSNITTTQTNINTPSNKPSLYSSYLNNAINDLGLPINLFFNYNSTQLQILQIQLQSKSTFLSRSKQNQKNILKSFTLFIQFIKSKNQTISNNTQTTIIPDTSKTPNKTKKTQIIHKIIISIKTTIYNKSKIILKNIFYKTLQYIPSIHTILTKYLLQKHFLPTS